LKRASNGFTLVELMITMSILGILLALAAPDFRRIIQQNLIDSEISGLQNLLMSARGEAIKRGQTVWVTSSGGNWTGTITAFVDIDGDFTQSGSEPTILTMAALTETVMVPSGGLATGIGYAGNGNIRGASAFNSTADFLDIQVPTLVGYPNYYVGRVSFALSGRTIAPRFKTPSASASAGVYQ
jgi:prepilin-type N-terminal cleavage/methylation domain-containing protein